MEMKIAEQIRSLSSPIEPIATDIEERLSSLENVKAVVFDIYGTLIISGSGDISLAKGGSRNEAFEETFDSLGVAVESSAYSKNVSDVFFEIIEKHQHNRRQEGIRFPEVEIRAIWDSFFALSKDLGAVRSVPSPEVVESLAVAYECRVNPVWPMPGLIDVISKLHERGLKLGIVSNAQFFTPSIFPATTGKTLQAFGFDPDLCVWSYRLREGKPSTSLYKLLASKLAESGIHPTETLFVGNDMRNDIWPADACGFKTALFAGDLRSLRLRERDDRVRNVKPTMIVKSLDALLRCLS